MDRTKALSVLIALLLAGCSGPQRIVVGSKNFTEQDILGEILAQHIERRLHVPVERKLHIGGTLLAHAALTSGAIDLYPEYTGTALTAILKQPPTKDAQAAFDVVNGEYRKRWRLAWLPPFGFNNTFAMVIRGETARARKLSALSEAAASGKWALGVGYEFLQRPDGLAGLQKTYRLQLAADPVSMDLGLLYQALAGRRVDMIAANSTDGLLSVLDVAVLRDDRGYFPPYECAAVVREDALARFPALRQALAALGGKIGEAKMRRLNYLADGEHRPVNRIAAEFLESIDSTGK